MFCRRYRRRRKTASPLLKLIVVLTVLTFILYLIFEYSIINVQKNIIENRAEVLSQSSINNAVSRLLSDKKDVYGDFVDITYSESGEVMSISADSALINLFKSELDLMIQEELANIHKCSVKVPLGAFSGCTFLSTYGPQIDFTYYLTAAVNSKIKSYFVEGGINQTVHHVELVIDAQVTLTSLGHDEKIPLSTNFEIAQTVINGKVPDTYVTGVEEFSM